MSSEKLSTCQKATLNEITKYCEREEIKLTPLRSDILAILTKKNKPLTAYVVLDFLKATRPNAQVMSVYRVLDFLLEKELIHRIENLNAFMPCCHLSEQHLSQWLICDSCGQATEYNLPNFSQDIETIEQSTGFQVNDSTIELIGTCQQCQQDRP